jgi:hypothetical protein
VTACSPCGVSKVAPVLFKSAETADGMDLSVLYGFACVVPDEEPVLTPDFGGASGTVAAATAGDSVVG